MKLKNKESTESTQLLPIPLLSEITTIITSHKWKIAVLLGEYLLLGSINNERIYPVLSTAVVLMSLPLLKLASEKDKA